MRTAPKVALSLIISLILFSGLAVAAYAGLFNVLETRFYQPSVVRSLESRLESVSKSLDAWHAENLGRFGEFVAADAVKRSLLPNQSSADVFDRANLAGSLIAERAGVLGIRIVDSGGETDPRERATRRIHFSTFPEDILLKEDFRISYEVYGKKADDLDFALISVPSGANARVVIDPKQDLFCYCLAFYDSYGTWRGTAVFYVAARAAVQRLVSESLLRLSDEPALLSDGEQKTKGFVTGLPPVGQELLENAIIDKWSRGDLSTERVVSAGESGWVLLSRQTGAHGITGQLVDDSLFTFPKSVRTLFLTVAFFTIFLVIFLVFNLKQDEMVVIRNRIRRFQIRLLEEIMETGEESSWEEMGKTIAWRKQDISGEIKKSFGKRLNKKHGTEIDDLLEKSWDEVLSAIGSQTTRNKPALDTQEIRLMLEQVLQNNAISLNLSGISGGQSRPAAAPPAQAVEAVEELDEVEAVEELDEVEAVEELDEVEAVEELDEAEAVEELDEVEAVEELDEAEAVEELDEIEAVEELDEAEAGEELDEAEAVEAVDSDIPVSEPGEYIVEMEGEGERPQAYSAETIASARAESDDALDGAEPDEVEYLDGEWEPELLEMATVEELTNFVEEMYPDTILVYNFEESPSLDRGSRAASPDAYGQDTDEYAESLSISGLDFSTLDELLIEDMPSVTYIAVSPFGPLPRSTREFDSMPAIELLEVIGDDEPAELETMEDADIGDGSVVARDGVFYVAHGASGESDDSLDPDFKELVRSVLR